MPTVDADLAAVIARVRAENAKVLGRLSKRIFGHTEPLSARDLYAICAAAEQSAKLREELIRAEFDRDAERSAREAAQAQLRAGR